MYNLCDRQSFLLLKLPANNLDADRRAIVDVGIV